MRKSNGSQAGSSTTTTSCKSQQRQDVFVSPPPQPPLHQHSHPTGPLNNWYDTKTTEPPNLIEKVAGWQKMSVASSLPCWLETVASTSSTPTTSGGPAAKVASLGINGNSHGHHHQHTPYSGLGGRGRTPSYEALKGAVTDLYRLDDFVLETLGAGFFSDVYKVTHKTSGRILVLKMNKYKSNRNNMLKEIQLMNKLKHPNILRFEAVCVHEGQLHALTEYIAGGNLEQLIGDTTVLLAWACRLELALHTGKGLMYLNSQGMFHRDLTSKNILIKKDGVGGPTGCSNKLTAVLGDFGLATKIPKKDDGRLPQVGSPYWMSPECLRGEYYDHQADIFSFGIVMCELIARCDADPDVLPRTQNFGVDYLLFSEMCPTCPPEFLKLAFTCVSIEPSTRPKSNELVSQLKRLLAQQRLADRQQLSTAPSAATAKTNTTATNSSVINTATTVSNNTNTTNIATLTSTIDKTTSRHNFICSSNNTPTATSQPPPPQNRFLKRFLSESGEHGGVKKTPSEKARLHSIPPQQHALITVKSVSEEMCLLDPHYTPRNSICVNPFATLPRLREGRKLIGSTVDLFSSCFELPSPRVSSPTDFGQIATRSLPSSPSNPHRELGHQSDEEEEEDEDDVNVHSEADDHHVPTSCLTPTRRNVVGHRSVSDCCCDDGGCSATGQSRVNLLRRMYFNRGFASQDDSALGLCSGVPPLPLAPTLRRWGSVESGIYSVSEDWFSGPISSRSICSSLLTVSDLEEDLRAASAFLSKKRTSSVFTDSIDDLSSRLDDISNTGLKGLDGWRDERGYEKDIRDIVEYFERNCVTKDRNSHSVNNGYTDERTSPEIARSQKIESLIKRVAENKNRACRAAAVGISRRHSPQQQPPVNNNLQVCDGIVRSKLQIFDQSKRRQPRAARFDQTGFVKSRRALFDGAGSPSPTAKTTNASTVNGKSSGSGSNRKLVGDILRQREGKLAKRVTSDSRVGSNTSSLPGNLRGKVAHVQSSPK